MAPVSYNASAPGSLMLLGEHAVLQGKKAIVLAIDKKIYVTLKPRMDRQITIQSHLGKLESSLDSLEIQSPFEFVIASILTYRSRLKCGFDLMIRSEVPENFGLGSSAAVTVAVISVLECFLGTIDIENRPQYIFQCAKKVILSVQGVGSGSDAAASVYGGCILISNQALAPLDRFSELPPLAVLYSGFKTPTPTVIRQVNLSRKKFPEIYQGFDELIDQLVITGAQLLKEKDWSGFGKIMKMQQGVMDAMGVGLPVLSELIATLNRSETIYGAKISGSGLGDCVIGLGQFVNDSLAPVVNVSLVHEGLAYG